MSLIEQRFAETIQRSIDNSSLLDGVRRTRNLLLDKSDWTQLSDNALSDAKRAEWASYRQQLRDITNTAELDDIVWPIQP
jgi:hypothetical protein